MWIIARNAKGRPILMHKAAGDHETMCGWSWLGWSVRRINRPAVELELLACKVCLKANGRRL